MILKYFPSQGFMINQISIDFFENRNAIRDKIAKPYEESDHVINLGEDEGPLYQRRDIYKGKTSAEFFFFLNYDSQDLLLEVEIHRCEKIQIFDITFDFNDEIDLVALKLSQFSEIFILSEGEIFFKDIKMVLSDKRKMGTEGSTIGYFYFAADVSHLINANQLF